MIKPVFIFSLPRSGSTLLQRLMMAHSQVSSVAEPWILLPLLYTLRPNGQTAEYSHRICQHAVQDLIENMRGGEEEYINQLRQFVEGIYASVARDGTVFFVDKTPRYYFVIPEIARLFPDARFIFLFRNPLQVYASILSTWGKGGFRVLWGNLVDLKLGPKLLSQGYEKLKESSLALRYEDLVANPDASLRRVCDYIGTSYEPTMLDKFSQQATNGRMGDPTGIHQYKVVEQSAQDKWMTLFSTKLRKRIAKKYLASLPEEALAIQGYNKETMLKEIIQIELGRGNPRATIMDAYYYVRSELIYALSRFVMRFMEKL
jgi:hypothetical protein